MKSTLGLILGLLVSSRVGFTADSVSPQPFTLGPRHFTDSDSIVIEQVAATSPELAVGDTITVRGRYVLGSVDRAELALYLTTSSDVGSQPTDSSQQTVIQKGSGSFELTEVVKHSGHLHLSFYPDHGGSSFGTIYFGNEQQMKEISHWDVSK